VKCFASKSAAGMNFKGILKINQDVSLSKNYILGHKNFLLFGVYDGHGKFYHKKIQY
jgi:serine/threonine protein phosphatase PrpC